MQDNKDITPYNHKGAPHGYWEIYWSDNTLAFNCFYVNNIRYGFQTNYTFNSKIIDKYYHAK
jgi:hypothetical protein